MRHATRISQARFTHRDGLRVAQGVNAAGPDDGEGTRGHGLLAMLSVRCVCLCQVVPLRGLLVVACVACVSVMWSLLACAPHSLHRPAGCLSSTLHVFKVATEQVESPLGLTLRILSEHAGSSESICSGVEI